MVKTISNKQEAIILSSMDFKESSKIVFIYTTDGKKSIKVLGAKRLNKNLLNFSTPITKVNYNSTNKEFPTLISFEVLDNYEEIKNNISKLFFSSLVLEIVYKIDELNNHERIYKYLNNTLNLIKTNDELLYTNIFLTKMLKVFGINPMFDNCVICNKLNPDFFSIEHGGALCNQHKTNTSYNINILNTLKQLYNHDISNKILFNNNEMIEVFYILNLYYNEHSHMKIIGFNQILKLINKN
ncbi:MAG: DNA repair protein RecO [Anaeroplasmataceae bacterium]